MNTQHRTQNQVTSQQQELQTQINNLNKQKQAVLADIVYNMMVNELKQYIPLLDIENTELQKNMEIKSKMNKKIDSLETLFRELGIRNTSKLHQTSSTRVTTMYMPIDIPLFNMPSISSRTTKNFVSINLGALKQSVSGVLEGDRQYKGLLTSLGAFKFDKYTNTKKNNTLKTKGVQKFWQKEPKPKNRQTASEQKLNKYIKRQPGGWCLGDTYTLKGGNLQTKQQNLGKLYLNHKAKKLDRLNNLNTFDTLQSIKLKLKQAKEEMKQFNQPQSGNFGNYNY